MPTIPLTYQNNQQNISSLEMWDSRSTRYQVPGIRFRFPEPKFALRLSLKVDIDFGVLPFLPNLVKDTSWPARVATSSRAANWSKCPSRNSRRRARSHSAGRRSRSTSRRIWVSCMPARWGKGLERTVAPARHIPACPGASAPAAPIGALALSPPL